MASQQDKFFYSYFISPVFTKLSKDEKNKEIKNRINFLETAVKTVTYGTTASKAAAQEKIDYLNALFRKINPDANAQAGGRKARKARKTRKHSRKVRKTRKH